MAIQDGAAEIPIEYINQPIGWGGTIEEINLGREFWKRITLVRLARHFQFSRQIDDDYAEYTRTNAGGHRLIVRPIAKILLDLQIVRDRSGWIVVSARTFSGRTIARFNVRPGQRLRAYQARCECRNVLRDRVSHLGDVQLSMHGRIMRGNTMIVTNHPDGVAIRRREEARRDRDRARLLHPHPLPHCRYSRDLVRPRPAGQSAITQFFTPASR